MWKKNLVHLRIQVIQVMRRTLDRFRVLRVDTLSSIPVLLTASLSLHTDVLGALKLDVIKFKVMDCPFPLPDTLSYSPGSVISVSKGQ